MKTILITGGTGLIGKALSKKLTEKNYYVKILTRNPKAINEFSWDISTGFIDKKAFENVDYIIHLAGTGIADKNWTEKRKKEIIDSRILSTQLLFQYIKNHNSKLKGFISSSAIGYYGAETTDKIFTETDLPTDDFISNVCQIWEKTSLEFNTLNVNTTIFRLGVVLSKDGGFLNKIGTPIITPLANGKQFLPWIHINDLTNMFAFAIENKLTGTYNAVAPEFQTNFSFSKLLAKKTKKLFLPFGVPKFILNLFFGEMASMLTEGSRVSADKIKNTGFTFTFNTLEKSLDNILSK